MNLHIHVWQRRVSFTSQVGKSLIKRCRCGRMRMGRLEWNEMTADDWREFNRLLRSLREGA